MHSHVRIPSGNMGMAQFHHRPIYTKHTWRPVIRMPAVRKGCPRRAGGGGGVFSFWLCSARPMGHWLPLLCYSAAPLEKWGWESPACYKDGLRLGSKHPKSSPRRDEAEGTCWWPGVNPPPPLGTWESYSSLNTASLTSLTCSGMIQGEAN